MNRMKALVATFIPLLFALALPGISAGAGSYTFKDITHPGATYTEAYGINNDGQVVGYWADDYHDYGFVYSDGSFTPLNYPGATDTQVLGISNNGTLIGHFADSGGAEHNFIRIGGGFKVIETPGIPYGINDSIKAVGTYNDYAGTHGFIASGNSFDTMDYPGATATMAWGINDGGKVAGSYHSPPQNGIIQIHGYVRSSSGSFTTIDYPGVNAGGLTSVNNKGQVAGFYDDATGEHAFVYDGQNFISLDYPGAAYTWANGINDNGEVVGGWCGSPCDVFHGFIAVKSRSISGTVKNRKGIPVEEVTITLSGASSDETKTAFDGTYTFSNVKSGTYTITPSKDKYTFKPKTIKATVKDEDLEGQDFTLQTFTISGVVKNKKGEPADGISMNLGGDSTDTTQTASDGTYSFTDLMNGKYTITPLPTTEWYYFKPISKNVTVHENDVKNQNFTGKSPCQISGRIIAGTTPVQGVTVALTGKSNDQVLTDADGSYQFGGLQEGSYVVTPSMTGYVFKATSRKVKITDSDIEDVNFSASALHSLSGAVTSGGSPLPDVTMSLTGKAKAATTTAVDGSYSFPNLQDGAYTVTPTMSGHKFTPPKQAVKMTGSDVTGVDFTGSP